MFFDGRPEDKKYCKRNERLQEICVDDFRIGRLEVIFNEYDRFVRDRG